MTDTQYQVVRPTPGLPEVGAILNGSEFVTSRRAQQLMEQRYILPLSGVSDYQPSVSTLLETPIRELRLMMAEVKDACLLHEALKTEERNTVRALFEKRIEELEAGQNEATV